MPKPFLRPRDGLRSRFHGAGCCNRFDELDAAGTARLAIIFAGWDGFVVAEAPIGHAEVIATDDGPVA